MKDGNVLIQSLAGRGDAVDGDVFNGIPDRSDLLVSGFERY